MSNPSAPAHPTPAVTERHAKLRAAMRSAVDEQIIPALKEFIEIPNLSRTYDKEWATNGLLQKACHHCIDYAKKLNIKGLTLDLIEEAGKTPMVFGIVEPTSTSGSPKNLMFYGHIDKQPHLTPDWREGLAPTKPVIENGLLYGRGGADDGYNFYTILSMLKILQHQNIPHDRIVLFFETDEESGSRDILFWVEKLKQQIGTPDIMFCLDSTSINNKNLSITTTLRGVVQFDFSVRMLDKSSHSGMASGIIPSTFRIARHLLDRIEDSKTGEMIDFNYEIPQDKLAQAKHTGTLQDDFLWKSFPIVKSGKPCCDHLGDMYLANIWKPQLEIIGQTGIPDKSCAGNVLRDETCLRISIRVPPNVDHKEFFNKVKERLTKDPPYGAEVNCHYFRGGNGWCSNEIPQTTLSKIETFSQQVFSKPVCFNGCGGSIPFIGELQILFPTTLLFVSGVLLPDGNAHGPNENLDIEYLRKFSEVLISFVADFNQS